MGELLLCMCPSLTLSALCHLQQPEAEDAVLEKDKVYRTTYMFSATMPPAVERLARKYMRRPVVVNIGRAGQATDNVAQRVIMIKENDKVSKRSQLPIKPVEMS